MDRSPSRGKVIVFGILFWYPLAGVTYQFLHYLEGLRRLGYDAYYVEDSGRWIYDPALNDLSPDPTPNIKAVLPVLEAHGFGDRWAFRGNYPDGQCYGMSEEQILALYRDADFFMNVTGAQEIRDEHLACKRRLYVESDPFPMQVRAAEGNPSTIATLKAHDTLFTFGENLGAGDCLVPVAGYQWLPTRQPVVTDFWPRAEDMSDAPFTTITTWHNKGKNVEWQNDTWYWTKDREFQKVLDLPRLRPNDPFELAVRTEPEVAAMLSEKNWRLADSVAVSAEVNKYRAYISHSRGEFTVARDQYVRPRTGWFSDRSACYLAAGRPVITQETGFSKYLPSGEGLFGFSTMDDILAAVDAIRSDYQRHCDAARAIAEEYFEAEKVVGSMLARAGL